jgi:hypothetical protein
MSCSVQSIPVPPGHGRPQTVKRNERRRRKRTHDLERARSETANMLKGTSAANAVPLGARPEPQQSTSTAITTRTPVPPTTNTSYMMSTLSNKNKRRGYKEAPATLTPKIVFGDETNLVASSSTVAITADVPAHELPRLVPPSERQDNGEIPASWRLFVTSVDVEGGMPRRGKKKKQQLAKAWDSQLDHDNGSYDNVQLDYDMADEEAVVSVVPVNDSVETNANAPSLDWVRVEQRFSDFAKVSDLDRCVVGTYFTWKVSITIAGFCVSFSLHFLRRLISIQLHSHRSISFTWRVSSKRTHNRFLCDIWFDLEHGLCHLVWQKRIYWTMTRSLSLWTD